MPLCILTQTQVCTDDGDEMMVMMMVMVVMMVVVVVMVTIAMMVKTVTLMITIMVLMTTPSPGGTTERVWRGCWSY